MSKKKELISLIEGNHKRIKELVDENNKLLQELSAVDGDEAINKLGIASVDNIAINTSNTNQIEQNKLNVLIIGKIGVGKSSTINALAGVNIAKVSDGMESETTEVIEYNVMNDLILWDTPGVGDTPEKDEVYKAEIVDKLNELKSNGEPLIDMALVVLDASSRDMCSDYDLIIGTLIPNIQYKDKIIIAMNQCDNALKGKGWNHQDSKPDVELDEFLKEKTESVKQRIIDASDLVIDPIYYSAETGYNVTLLRDALASK